MKLPFNGGPINGVSLSRSGSSMPKDFNAYCTDLVMDGTRVRKEEVVEEALRQLGKAADKGNASDVPQAFKIP